VTSGRTASAVHLDSRLLTAAEVGELLQLRTSTVYELARAGQLSLIRVGRAIRFYRGDLEEHRARIRQPTRLA
jgi:excisionase family DNA binding protein